MMNTILSIYLPLCWKRASFPPQSRQSDAAMLRLRRPLRSASTLLLFGSARSFSLLGPLSSSRLRLPCNLRVRCQASIPDSEEGWRAVLSPSQFSVLRNAATEPSGYSENKEGELEYKLKTELKTKYPADGAYWYASQRG